MPSLTRRYKTISVKTEHIFKQNENIYGRLYWVPMPTPELLIQKKTYCCTFTSINIKNVLMVIAYIRVIQITETFL